MTLHVEELPDAEKPKSPLEILLEMEDEVEDARQNYNSNLDNDDLAADGYIYCMKLLACEYFEQNITLEKIKPLHQEMLRVYNENPAKYYFEPFCEDVKTLADAAEKILAEQSTPANV